MTQPQLPKACTARVRKAAEFEPCNTKLINKKDYGYVCPNRQVHVMPLITGFCHSGWHEGMKIDKPTCKFWITCPCDCHTSLSRMYAMTDTERVMVNNSTYVPDRGSFVRVSLTDAVEKAIHANPTARVVESAAPAVVPSTVEKQFAPTASGRTARGQLELWVKRVTDDWALSMPENCTPQYIARTIRVNEKLDKEPSTGAIDAVLRRWVAIGFAITGSKPIRFVRYTPDGITHGLEILKDRARRA